VSHLKDHLLNRIIGNPFDGDEMEFSDEDRSSIIIVRNRIYRHSVLKVNYTTYDMRRAQDSINPRTHPNIMVLSHEDDPEQDGSQSHPYWYARVIGIFHAEVKHVGPKSKSTQPQMMYFLHVRWYARESSYSGGWEAKRLHWLCFFPTNDDTVGIVQ
jgi:hypothetical protein